MQHGFCPPIPPAHAARHIVSAVSDGAAREFAQEFYGRPKQVVQPFHFGDPFIKGIHLWLKGLPPLWHDNEVVPTGRIATGGGSWRTDKALLRQAMSAHEDSEGRKNRARVRSRTMPGLARAMAEQWTPFAEEYYRERDSLR